MKLKTGKEEIVYLLSKVIQKYEAETGQRVIRNSNRKNYEGVARTLSEISNRLPQTSATLQHEAYPADYNPKNLDYPFRKYDITGNQIKDAYFNQIVSNPRPFLVDAGYIYLFGMGRKGFEGDPKDEGLLKNERPSQTGAAASSDNVMANERATSASSSKFRPVISKAVLWVCLAVLSAILMVLLYKIASLTNEWATVRQDMKLLSYQPTQKEIDSLEGVWLCYTGSPQARSSDPDRYHTVVTNVVDVKYKNGYFTFNRYGASFDHTGYMQFESPWIVSVHSSVKNNSSIVESPRHSLMRLDKESRFVPVISASWNFDAGRRNSIIGIREVYIKQGRGGYIEEVFNTPENAACRCKIVRWQQEADKVKTFYLRNEKLDRIQDSSLKKLLDERSILLREPGENLVLSDSSGKRDVNE